MNSTIILGINFILEKLSRAVTQVREECDTIFPLECRLYSPDLLAQIESLYGPLDAVNQYIVELQELKARVSLFCHPRIRPRFDKVLDQLLYLQGHLGDLVKLPSAKLE